jgi:SAM-dependent methyltransferase
MKNKIDEVVEFLLSFYRGKYDYKDMIKSWDVYLLNKTESNLFKFRDIVIDLKTTYYYPVSKDYIFLNSGTPDKYIQYVKDHKSTIWNNFVIENELNDKEIIQAYIKTFDPLSNKEEFDDYCFSQNYNSIYFSDFISQKKTFYNLFNKNFNHPFTKSCMIDQNSLIMNLNNLIDCQKIFNILNIKNKRELDIISDYEKNNIKHFNDYYQNDIDTITYYLEELDRINSLIDSNLITLYNRNDFVKISMEYFNEDMYKQIRFMYEYLNIFNKYIILTSYATDLNTIDSLNKYSNKIDINLFIPKMKYYENAIKCLYCVDKYNSVIYEFYGIRMNEETNKKKNPYTLYNLNVTMQQKNPHFDYLYSNYAKAYIKEKIKSNIIPKIHYVPVNSNSQILNYLQLGNINNQITPLVNLVSRFVNYNTTELTNIFTSVPTSSATFSKSNVNTDNDINIYNKLRENRKIKEPELKNKRNKKRANEVFKFISDEKKKMSLPIGGDQFYHLDYGGNDGGVASELAKLMKINNTQMFSADVEKWLGNTKKNVYDNITYTLLSENQKLPYRDNSFDSISCLQVLHHIEFIDVHVKELHRVLKPGGILVIKEHDCNNTSTEFLIDIEHMIHEYVEPNEPNIDILNNYAAFYKSFTDLNELITDIGFEFITDNYDFNIKFNPTRYYFAIYKKLGYKDYIELQNKVLIKQKEKEELEQKNIDMREHELELEVDDEDEDEDDDDDDDNEDENKVSKIQKLNIKNDGKINVLAVYSELKFEIKNNENVDHVKNIYFKEKNIELSDDIINYYYVGKNLQKDKNIFNKDINMDDFMKKIVLPPESMDVILTTSVHSGKKNIMITDTMLNNCKQLLKKGGYLIFNKNYDYAINKKQMNSKEFIEHISKFKFKYFYVTFSKNFICFKSI